MSWVLPKEPITPQELLDALTDLFAAYYYHGGKTELQFDAMDQAALAAQRAEKIGLKIKCRDIRNPDPPKPDLPLFNAFDV